MMKRIFRFAARPDVYVDPTWGDPDRLPENSQSPDSAPTASPPTLPQSPPHSCWTILWNCVC